MMSDGFARVIVAAQSFGPCSVHPRRRASLA